MYDKEHPLINKVKEQFADGRMGRRDFLRYSTLLGMSAMAAYAFVGKVTGIDYVPQAGAASMPVGGTMRVAQRVAEVSDAHALSWFFWSNKVFPVCQTLSRTGADNITRPLLAKGFSANEDLTSWTIHLRPEAKWTSGRPFIADDVIANLEHLLDPDTGSSAVGLMAYLMKDVEKDGETTKMIWDANALEKVDDFTLRMNIQVPQVAIPEHFFHYTNTMLDPEEGWSYRPGANGTGPMELAELTPRGKCVFTKKKDHWGTAGLCGQVRVRRHRRRPRRGIRRPGLEASARYFRSRGGSDRRGEGYRPRQDLFDRHRRVPHLVVENGLRALGRQSRAPRPQESHQRQALDTGLAG